MGQDHRTEMVLGGGMCVGEGQGGVGRVTVPEWRPLCVLSVLNNVVTNADKMLMSPAG